MLDAVIIILSSVAIILHSFGLILLIKARKRSFNNAYFISQHIYLSNLSFSETMFSLTGLLRVVVKFHGYEELNRILFIINTGNFVQIILFLTALTLDRFLTVYYNLKYILIWDTRKTKIVIILIYQVSILFIAFSVALIKSIGNAFEIFTFYVWLPIDVLFMVTAVFSYTFLLSKVLKINPVRNQQTKSKKSIIVILGLLLSFTVFSVTPDTISLVKSIRKEKITESMEFYLSISYRLGTIMDAFIYIMFSPGVRQSLSEMFNCC